MSDYNCPDCGSGLPPSNENGDTTCVSCDWEGNIEDASPDTSSPFDVEGRPPRHEFDEETGEVIIHLSKDRRPIRLSPDKAENFAESLNHAARDARGKRDPKDSHI